MSRDVSDATGGLSAVFFVSDVIVEMAILCFFYLKASSFTSLFFIPRSVIFLAMSITSSSDDFPRTIFFFSSTKYPKQFATPTLAVRASW